MQNIVTLGQINDALKITSVTAAQLAEMGFAALENKPICEALPPEESRRLRNAKLYQADSIVQIRMALAKRLAAPASCLHQVQEPATKPQALAHYSQQASLAMGKAATAAVAVPDERAAFEKWARWCCYDITTAGGGAQYESNGTEQVWLAWKQRAALASTPAAAAPENVWQKAVDKELVSAHLGVAGDVTPAEAAKALHELICWNIEVTTNPQTNGGKVLVPAAAPVVLPEPDAALLNQGIELLHALSCDERNRGNCSAAEGATASADAVQRLAVTLLAGVSAPAAQAVEQSPVLYVSKEQLNAHTDHLDREHGRYLPVRVTPAGKFTTPLFTAPQAQADARDARDARDNGINHGVCLALQIMTAAGDAGSTQWRELVNVAGRAELEHYAKTVEPDEWELGGFADVERSENEDAAIAAQAAQQGGAA